MHAVVAPGHPAVVGKPLLRAIELRLADGGGYRGRDDPLGRVQGLLRPRGAAADGEQGGAAPRGGMAADAVGEDLADIGGVGQHAAQGRGVPGRASPGRGDAQPGQALPHGQDRGALVGEPGEQVAHHRRLRLLHPHPSRIAWPLGVEPVAIGRPRPRQQGAGAQLAQAAAAHALGDQGALVLGHGAADLQQQLVVRVAAHRPVEEHHLRPVLLQLLDQERLVHVVARQPVRLGDQDAVEPGARGGVAQAVQARAPQAGAAVAVVAEDTVRRQVPALRSGVGAQPIELLVSALCPGLALGRYPEGQTLQTAPVYSQLHGSTVWTRGAQPALRLMRCGRTPGAPGPASGSTRWRRWPPQLLGARPPASAGRRR